MISARRTIPPSVEPVTLDQAKAQCRIAAEDDRDDTTLLLYIKAAREYAEKQMARAILQQTWIVSFDHFPSWLGRFLRSGDASWYPAQDRFHPHMPLLELPWPRLMSVDLINYLDTTGAWQTLPAASYAADMNAEPARIGLAPGAFWPATLPGRSDAVQITFTAGYGSTPDSVPAAVQLAILGLVAHWYENRESVVLTNSPNAVTTVPQFVDSLLQGEAAPAVFGFEV